VEWGGLPSHPYAHLSLHAVPSLFLLSLSPLQDAQFNSSNARMVRLKSLSYIVKSVEEVRAPPPPPFFLRHALV
jgi:hypothetical protein